jgi:hypothetical protein
VPGAQEPVRWARLGRICFPNAPAPSLPAVARDSLPTHVGREDEDDRWARIARDVPGGFGGYFLRGPGGPAVIYLREPKRKAEALTALNARPFGGSTIGNDVLVERGRWDYVQLHEWYRYLTARLEEPGLVSTDLDAARNRITIGVVDAAARRRLEARLTALGVPCFLVAIEVGPRPSLSKAG